MSRNNEGQLVLGRKRRSWTLDEQRRIVDESLEDGASIAEVARRHDLNANQLFTWRRQFRVEPTVLKEFGPVLPVTIVPETTAEYSHRGSSGQMEVILAGSDRIIVWSDVELSAFSRALEALSRR